MSKRQARIQLRTVLASLYPDREDAERVVGDAGLDSAYIAFSEKAINNWENILAEAEKHGMVDAIARVARREYPRNEELAQIHEAYLAAGEEPGSVTETIDESRPVNLAVLADLLQAAFSASDLRRFCLYRPQFRDVLDNVSERPGLNELVDAVIQYCERQALLHTLVREVKEENPRQYENFKARLFA